MDRLDRGAVVRGFRQVTADFNSGNGMDVDGIRHDVSVGAMYIMEASFGFSLQPAPTYMVGRPRVTEEDGRLFAGCHRWR